MTPLEEMKQWVQDYKDDEEPIRAGQVAAIKAIDHLIEAFPTTDDVRAIVAAQQEVRRMLEILNAFQGKLSIIAYMRGEKPFDDDDDDDD